MAAGTGTKIGDAFVEIGTKDDKLTKNLATSRKAVSAWGSRTGKTAGMMTRAVARFRTMVGLASFALAGLFAAKGLGGIAKLMDNATRETRKLEAVLRTTGYAAGYTTKQMQIMADQLGDIIKVDDNVIEGTQAVLATFKKIKGDVFKEALEVLYDMSAVLGQDAKQGAIQLGKALNDPLTGMLAMRRVGVSFSEEQIKQVKNFVAQGKLVDAQRIILKELQSEFGGAARKMATPLQTMTYEWGNVKEAIAFAIGDLFNFDQILIDIGEKLKTVRKRIEEMKAAGDFIVFAEEFKAAMKMALNAIMTPWKMIVEVQARQLANLVDNAIIAGERIAAALTGELDSARDFTWHSFTEGLEQVAKDAEKIDAAILDKMNANIERRTKAAEDSASKIVAAEDEVTKAKKRSMGVFQSFGDIVREAQKSAIASATGAAGGKPLSRDEANAVIRVEQDKEATDLLRSMDDFLKKIEGKLPSPVFS